MLWFLTWIAHAHAADITLSEGEDIQDAIDGVVAGDTIELTAGTYEVDELTTKSDGTADAPITLRAVPGETVTLLGSGQILQVDHAHWLFDGIIFDGGFGAADTIKVESSANHTTLHNVEVRNSKRDCIEMEAPVGVTISNSEIHHCLFMDPDDGDRLDAHAITTGAVHSLTIENTKIHTFSGDGLHLGSGRTAPGWNDVRIDGCQIWLTPLTEETAGFATGAITGENAIETQTWNDAPTANLEIKNSSFWGFQNGIDVSDQAAILVREHVNASISRTTVSGSNIAFRLRGPTSARPLGPTVHIDNTLIHDVITGIQYEDSLSQLKLWHVTMGLDITDHLVAVDSDSTAPDVQNSLFLADELPEYAASEEHNLTATASDFVNPGAGDHRLASTSDAIDAGQLISGMDFDRDGNERPQGDAPDVGAHEFTGTPDEPGDTGDTGEAEEDAPPDEADEPTETNDTGANPDQNEPPNGIGAAEQVGEKGGCGCTTSPSTEGLPIWFLLVGIGLARRDRKIRTEQFFT